MSKTHPSNTHDRGDPDPVIQAYLAGIDRTLLARNLALGVDERFRQLMELQRLAVELGRAGERARKR